MSDITLTITVTHKHGASAAQVADLKDFLDIIGRDQAMRIEDVPRTREVVTSAEYSVADVAPAPTITGSEVTARVGTKQRNVRIYDSGSLSPESFVCNTPEEAEQFADLLRVAARVAREARAEAL